MKNTINFFLIFKVLDLPFKEQFMWTKAFFHSLQKETELTWKFFIKIEAPSKIDELNLIIKHIIQFRNINFNYKT